jgi:mycothiol synthase
VLNTGLTATRRDFRRMGIALALKLRAIAYAQDKGYREVRTGNESNNRPMLSINEALGFVKQPVWITMVKTFV